MHEDNQNFKLCALEKKASPCLLVVANHLNRVGQLRFGDRDSRQVWSLADVAHGVRVFCF